MKASTKAIRFLESLKIPEGPKAGQSIKLAPFQKTLFAARLRMNRPGSVGDL